MAILDDIKGVSRPSATPIEVEYKRYRSKRRGYIVVVTNVTHHRGQHGYYTAVTVRDDKGKHTTWPGVVFLRGFEPVGRKIKPNRYKRIRGKDVV